MFLRLRNITIIMGMLIVSWLGWNIYGYFFDVSLPSISLVGIQDDGCYCQDVNCAISGGHRYKISNISVWLDDKAIVNGFKIGKSHFKYPFSVCTKTLSNGKHTLKVEAIDGTRRRNVSVQTATFHVDNMPLHAAFIRPDTIYTVSQGKTLHVQFQVNKKIKSAHVDIIAKNFDCLAEAEHSLIYECFIPVSCEEKPNEYPFVVEIEDYVGNRARLEGKFQVVPFPFKRRALHVGKEKVAAEQEAGRSQVLLEERIAALVKESSAKKLWNGLFIFPVAHTGFSCPFGEIRTTQEKGRYTHNGLDVLALPKSVVWATQDGKVVLKDRYEYSGNTVIIDHGLGIFSLFFHLEGFTDINVGDMIKKGNPLGAVGKTGYATGYHLHWEMRIGNIPVDPLQWTAHDF